MTYSVLDVQRVGVQPFLLVGLSISLWVRSGEASFFLVISQNKISDPRAILLLPSDHFPLVMMQTVFQIRAPSKSTTSRVSTRTNAVRATGVTVSDVKGADGGRMVVEVDGQKVRAV